jgi:membrane protein implicated in regulation of membrane protease activity
MIIFAFTETIIGLHICQKPLKNPVLQLLIVARFKCIFFNGGYQYANRKYHNLDLAGDFCLIRHHRSSGTRPCLHLVRGGALLAIILSIIPGVPFWVEIIVFLVVSFVLIFAIRRWPRNNLYKKEIKSNIEKKSGEKCVVIKAINELAHGEVKLNGVIWTAIARNKKEVFEEQSVVTIVGIDGNKLIVEKFETGKEENNMQPWLLSFYRSSEQCALIPRQQY